jgi:hypothetical protein
MRIISLGSRVVNEEIARQRLIHPAETGPSLHALAFRRLADETGPGDKRSRGADGTGLES